MYAFFARTSHWFELWYRFGTPPWVGQARSELVELVESGGLLPGRAIDLGCGEGDNAILLAQHGFQVTVVDFSPAAIAKAKASKASGLRSSSENGSLSAPVVPKSGPFAQP